VAYADLGELGTQDSEPVVYNWPATCAVLRLLPWLVLAILAFLRSRRGQTGWRVFIPVIAVMLILFAIQQVLPYLHHLHSRIAEVSLPPIVSSLVTAGAFGIAALWLLSHRMTNRGRLRRLLFAAFVMLLFGATVLLIFEGTEIGPNTVPVLIIYGMCVLLLLLATTIASRLNRRRFSFLGGLLMGCVLCGGLLCPATILVVMAVSGHGDLQSDEVLRGLTYGGAMGLIAGLATFAVAFPFAYYALRHPVRRAELAQALGIEQETSTHAAK